MLYSQNILNETNDRLQRLMTLVTPVIPGTNQGLGSVNIFNGAVTVQIFLPDAGAFAPVTFLTYNSKLALQSAVTVQIFLPDAGAFAPVTFLTYNSKLALQTEYWLARTCSIYPPG